MINSSKKVRFITLGCKVNTYETQGMREALERFGIEECADLREPCDVVVINTCTVTAQADRENRYWIRRARREHGSAKIIVTGCYAEKNRDEIESLNGVDCVVPNGDKAAIANYILDGTGRGFLRTSRALPSAVTSRADLGVRPDYTPLFISRFEGRGRAYLKIQDGCNHACSFCKVVLVRGRSRSRPLPDVLEEVYRLRDSGYREIVFTGIQLGAYGRDFENRKNLTDVLELCSKVEGIERLRLSCVEPADVTPGLIKALKGIAKCCPHLHIPLQSGDDTILRRMNRRYGRSFYIDLVSRLKEAMPEFSLTLDVLAGFPGEDDSHFQNTVRLLETVKPLKSHVFPYSRREGTTAARFRACPSDVLRKRARKLLALSDLLGFNERSRYVGKLFSVLVERKSPGKSLLFGLTRNYLKVSFPGPQDWVGKMIPVRLETIDGDTFVGSAGCPSEECEGIR